MEKQKEQQSPTTKPGPELQFVLPGRSPATAPEPALKQFIKAISKVPEIDTAVAREKILEQLLREPREYIATCAAALVSAERDVSVREHVVMAHRVADYRALIEAHGIHMLVFPALEEDALALNGNSYSLAVELVDTPLLML